MRKKFLCFVMTGAMLLSTTTVADAQINVATSTKQTQEVSQTKEATQTKKVTKTKKNVRIKEKKQSFKISKSTSVIKYGRYKLPINPVKKGMGATVAFDKETAVLTVTKGTTTIVISFKDKTVTVNGTVETNTGIFTASNSKKMTVLIKYIAKTLGVRCSVKGNKITTLIPGLDLPTGVTVTPVGGTVVANTLNTTTVSLTATANVVANQAVGGKAELYVGSTLVATDSTIEATDKTVTFTTADKTLTNADLQALIPQGGKVTVKLYNASKQSVVSKYKNPKLSVDYVAPTVTDVTTAAYSVSGGAITVVGSGFGAVEDQVDVTKITVYNSTLNKSYQLRDVAVSGSKGFVTSDTQLTITLGSADRLAVEDLLGSTLSITIAAGSLLKDEAGNVSPIAVQKDIPVTVQ